MKIALCLHNQYNNVFDFTSIATIFKNADIFIHCWDDGPIDRIIQDLKPNKLLMEPKKTMDAVKEKWYSIYQADLLRREYETVKRFKYDLVICARLDCRFTVNISLTKYNANTFWLNNNYIEHMFMSGSGRMSEFCELYIDLPKYTSMLKKKLSNENVIKHRLDNMGFVIGAINEAEFKVSIK